MTVAMGETYNYSRFKMTNYELGYFPGPKAGENVSYDYTLTDLNGKEVKLSDYKGKWLVIESGSRTCPMYVKNVKSIFEFAEYNYFNKKINSNLFFNNKSKETVIKLYRARKSSSKFSC